jgi:ABC-type bacteriocin/lantibiotic exporter with double-glycine peptidase domain
LLIYDEPTSSLDSQNTMYFDQYLESLRDKVTIIYITHKEPNRMLFDFVYKLEGGQLRMM